MSDDPWSARVLTAQIPVPQHRMTPLKMHWLELYKPITENLKLDMRMNLKTKKVCAACYSTTYSTTAATLVHPPCHVTS